MNTKVDKPETVPGTSIAQIINTITHREMQEVIRKSLPPNVPQEKFTQAAIAALKHRPEIFLDCERASVYNAVVDAAKDGLLPDGRHGALVPFNTKIGDKWIKKCQFLIMPEGIIDKLAAIGITAYAVSVHEGDKIKVWNDDYGQHVDHEPATFGHRGQRLGAFACARIRSSGATYVEAMNMEDLEAPRAVTKSKDKNGKLVGPWADFPDRMEQKTCLHRICKRLPNVSMSEDEEFRETERGPVTLEASSPPVVPPTNGGRPAALQKVVEQAAEPTEEPPPFTDTEVPY
jgi:recombination protein RecT